ncbi:hypothetical protein CKO_01432 [Citrobacter koseri ATCC BAA-895]|uniref:Uncharacterized protein n=1 Tax=Citrobacter koseri (strain ATCC BAA-895 / CDC 4225-83 / SGSC4696) TaxID=290338 RepID=A8AGF2_CITK8|nr:hypothetical protein CKO_01432 [Citrobacter koseri ATCC BAA-895]
MHVNTLKLKLGTIFIYCKNKQIQPENNNLEFAIFCVGSFQSTRLA